MTKNTQKPKATAMDKRIGQNLYALRRSRKLSQKHLADFLGISFQQIQKYEKGQNRISAANLYKLSREFGVPYNYFFLPDTDDCTDDLLAQEIANKLYIIKDTAVKTKISRIIDVMLS